MVRGNKIQDRNYLSIRLVIFPTCFLLQISRTFSLICPFFYLAASAIQLQQCRLELPSPRRPLLWAAMRRPLVTIEITKTMHLYLKMNSTVSTCALNAWILDFEGVEWCIRFYSVIIKESGILYCNLWKQVGFCFWGGVIYFQATPENIIIVYQGDVTLCIWRRFDETHLPLY